MKNSKNKIKLELISLFYILYYFIPIIKIPKICSLVSLIQKKNEYPANFNLFLYCKPPQNQCLINSGCLNLGRAAFSNLLMKGIIIIIIMLMINNKIK
jgi:hypothetical protein